MVPCNDALAFTYIVSHVNMEERFEVEMDECMKLDLLVGS